MPLPRIAITCGDPAGVGPELCLQIAALPSLNSRCVPIILGDASVFVPVAARLGLTVPPITNNRHVAKLGSATVVDLGSLSDHQVQPGQVTADTGRAAYAYLEEAIRLAMAGDVCAIVTGPIHKEALHAAGIPFTGHTEILAAKTQADRICMMLTSDQITCSLVTTHIGLADVPNRLTAERILDCIELSHDAIKRMRAIDGKLTVCGLNPHAGEHGLFGNREEQRLIEPAIDLAKKKGIRVRGPLPPDTAFLPSIRAQTDCYVCMYHDQGLIPLKALAFDTAVNVTLGLPIVRTSVDHGTALDIAWQGKATTTSFQRAVELALRLASRPGGDHLPE